MSEATQRQPATPEEVWAILREVSASQRETDRRMQETDRQMKETDRKLRRLEDLFNGQCRPDTRTAVPARFPFYLVAMEVVFFAVAGSAVIPAIRDEQSFAYIIRELADHLNTYVAAALLTCGAIEGLAMGLTKVLFSQAREQGRQETSREAIRLLVDAGQVEAANLLRDMVFEQRHGEA